MPRGQPKKFPVFHHNADNYFCSFGIGKKLEVVEPKLQISSGDFNTWCIDNNIGVHYGKTHAFVVGSKHMTSANEGISVTINEYISRT